MLEFDEMICVEEMVIPPVLLSGEGCDSFVKICDGYGVKAALPRGKN